MDVSKLTKDCIKEFNLDVNQLRDIAFAICISDKLVGTNRLELDIDKFVESDSELDWGSILGMLGIEPQNKGYTKLPRVHKLRIISDILSLVLSNNISDLELMCPSSKSVASKIGVSLPNSDYADEDYCYANLAKIEKYLTSSSIDLSGLDSVYKRLCIYSERIINVGGFNLPINIEKILIPDKIFKNLGKKCTIEDLNKFLQSHNLTIESYATYIIDVYCYELVQEIAKLLNKRFKRNEVEFNLILTRLNNFAVDYLPLGTYSLNNYTQRLSVLRNVPSYLNRKVNIVFSDSSTFSESTILGCISALYLLRKINIKKEFLLSEMEGLVNECRG